MLTETLHPRQACRTVVLALVLAGIAAAGARAGVPAPQSLASKCGSAAGVRATPLWLQTDDGQRIYAADGGSGDAGVVLAPESPGDLCGWLPYMRTLEQAGLRVLAFDFRGMGDSPAPATYAKQIAFGHDFAAAIARLRADGARKVIVVGASFGGAAALTFGPLLDADGIVSLSGEADLPASHLNALAAVPRLRAPLLIVGTRYDAYLPVPSALRLLRRAGSHDKRTAFFPGGWHGWDIVEQAPYAARARALVLGWIRAHTRA